jgi:DNA-directed RNA polymerase specialized sigma24 family protein
VLYERHFDDLFRCVHALVGLEGAELGVALGVSSSAASVRLHRARTSLRATLPPTVLSYEEDRE